jgi:gamma-glutamylcyclotransferase (GGCT)/AIG2-like uncharacterized protein YtfP
VSTFNLFAYGTLAQGSAAESLLEGCDLVGDGVVRGILYDINGRFPAVVLYGAAPVHGRIWRCPADLLLKLDEYEGTAQGLFRRVALDVEHDAGHMPCWLYTAGPALSRQLTAERRIDGGRWETR